VEAAEPRGAPAGRPAAHRLMGQWWGQLIDQFPMAAVVVNCPPFKGALTACHPHQAIHHRHADDQAAVQCRLRSCSRARYRTRGVALLPMPHPAVPHIGARSTPSPCSPSHLETLTPLNRWVHPHPSRLLALRVHATRAMSSRRPCRHTLPGYCYALLRLSP
jgi:hypothetical protein